MNINVGDKVLIKPRKEPGVVLEIFQDIIYVGFPDGARFEVTEDECIKYVEEKEIAPKTKPKPKKKTK